MNRADWESHCGFFLAVHGVADFVPAEVCAVGRMKGTASLLSPPPEFMLHALKLIEGPLNWIRWYRGAAPVSVNSWYRSADYNRAVGGSTNSMHLTCGAADINKAGWEPKAVALALHNDYAMADKLGLGLYKNFVHVDIRGMLGRPMARWAGDGAQKNWWAA